MTWPFCTLSPAATIGFWWTLVPWLERRNLIRSYTWIWPRPSLIVIWSVTAAGLCVCPPPWLAGSGGASAPGPSRGAPGGAPGGAAAGSAPPVPIMGVADRRGRVGDFFVVGRATDRLASRGSKDPL